MTVDALAKQSVEEGALPRSPLDNCCIFHIPVSPVFADMRWQCPDCSSGYEAVINGVGKVIAWRKIS